MENIKYWEFVPGLGGGACDEKPPCERTDSHVLSCVRGRGFQCKFPGVAGKKMASSITPSDRTAYTHKSTYTFRYKMTIDLSAWVCECAQTRLFTSHLS